MKDRIVFTKIKNKNIFMDNPKSRVYLISGDKHFDVITTRIKALLGKQAHVLCAENIREVRR